MAIFRNVSMSFWTDTKIIDDFTPEDKYFMLWALTNNYTNIIGCYEISIKQISNDLGYNKDTIEALLKRFCEVHKKILYDFDTKELLVVNWSKYNWNASPKLDSLLNTTIEKVKSTKFHDYLANIYNQRESVNDMVLIPYRYGIDTTITISSTNTITNSIDNINNIKEKEIYKEKEKIEYNEIIDYLNLKTNSNYKSTTPKTRELIKARYNEGFTLDDFKQVIDNKVNAWGSDEKMVKYLRPETLFSNKFEGYLNEKVAIKKLDAIDQVYMEMKGKNKL